MRPPGRLLPVVALGGAAGAVLRFGLGEWFPPHDGFPWTTFAINVTGAFLLALLPGLAPVRRSVVWTAALGPGLLGGYTTLSAYAEETRALLADGRAGLAGAYVLATLVACCAVVVLATRWSTPAAQDEVATEGGDA
ncbi:CrcB family protein [Nocardioides sp. 1609]|uniref:fluoride efflux transporter FluC n=1 Tax=Nocardioides sp. 1609 TaxID=2508327 RepID=UPI001430FBB0|nr:CrcB family protein [Nocardioides sp. 1609]